MQTTEAYSTMVVFSKDRPLQVDAALTSWKRHCRDAASTEINVIYKASTSRMLSLYRRLMQEHPDVNFIREGDFRRDVLVLARSREYIFYAVDDTVFVRDFEMAEIAAALKANPDALGFSLRLGTNTNYCYTLNRPQKLPEFEKSGGFLKFRWPDAECDFGYPLEVSSSVYRTAEMIPLLDSLQFRNPNTLENAIASRSEQYRASHPCLLCPGQTQAFSIPANMTQSVCVNRIADAPDYSVERLEKRYVEGERIDTAVLDNMVPKGAHEEVIFTFSKKAQPVPAVSIIVPCYNQARFLPEAVASVAAQTFDDWELIIVNDGSKDDTSVVAQKLIAQNPGRRIRLLEKENGGLAHARNAGMGQAQGAYILPLDADDCLAPAMLEKTVALLQAKPEIAIAYTDVKQFGNANDTIAAADYDFRKLCENNQLNYCALFRREAWEAAGGYNANMIWGYEDWDFWIGGGELGLVAQRISEPLFLYRRRNESMFAGAVSHDKELRARITLNHPKLYDARSLSEAQKIWGDPALPLPPGAPKVSVIVPTYNRPVRLEETIRSILAQSLQDFEIIVVNDNGVDVSNRVAGLDLKSRIVYHRHPSNRGLAAARNTGLRFARGKFIAFLDDDDIFLPGHLETLVNFLESSGKRAAYTDSYCAEEKLENGRFTIIRRTVPFSEDWDDERILVHNIAPVNCFMFERSAGVAAGPLDETLTTHEDWDFWIRLGRVAPPAHLKKVTSEFRARTDGSSMTSSLRPDFVRTARLIYDKNRPYTAGNKPLRERQEKYLRGLEKNARQQSSASWLQRFKKHLSPAVR